MKTSPPQVLPRMPFLPAPGTQASLRTSLTRASLTQASALAAASPAQALPVGNQPTAQQPPTAPNSTSNNAGAGNNQPPTNNGGGNNGNQGGSNATPKASMTEVNLGKPAQNVGSLWNNFLMALVVLVGAISIPYFGLYWLQDGMSANDANSMFYMGLAAWLIVLILLWMFGAIGCAIIPRRSTGVAQLWGLKIHLVFASGPCLTFGRVFFQTTNGNKMPLRGNKDRADDSQDDVGIDVTIHGPKAGDLEIKALPSQVPAEVKLNVTYFNISPLDTFDNLGLTTKDREIQWLDLDDTTGGIPKNKKHKNYLENLWKDVIISKLRHEVFPRMSLEELLVLNGTDDDKTIAAKNKLDTLLTAAMINCNKIIQETLAPGIFISMITVTKVEVSIETLKQLGWVTEEMAQRTKFELDAETNLELMKIASQGATINGQHVPGAGPHAALLMAMMPQGPERFHPAVGTALAGLQPILAPLGDLIGLWVRKQLAASATQPPPTTPPAQPQPTATP